MKNLYFILIQICFSQLKYITQHVFFKLKKRFCLRSVDAAWSKVFFLSRVRCGSVPLYTTKPAQAQGSRLPAMRHRSLNNFHKKWDNNKIYAPQQVYQRSFTFSSRYRNGGRKVAAFAGPIPLIFSTASSGVAGRIRINSSITSLLNIT